MCQKMAKAVRTVLFSQLFTFTRKKLVDKEAYLRISPLKTGDALNGLSKPVAALRRVRNKLWRLLVFTQLCTPVSKGPTYTTRSLTIGLPWYIFALRPM